MTAILIFIVILVGLNCIPLLFKTNFSKLEKVITQILAPITIAFIIITILSFFDYRLKGIYSNTIIGLAFVLANILFFSLVKNTRKKLISVFLLTPLILLGLYSLIFGQKLHEYQINDHYKIEVSNGGPLSCGEIIKITKSKLGILDKEIYYDSDLCLIGITKIETLKFNNNHAEFLIYHNGEMDSENPYKYEIENKNVW